MEKAITAAADPGKVGAYNTIICAVCGKEVEKKSHRAIYCGEKCKRKAMADKRINAISKRARNINKVALATYCSYDYKCALCGWQATPDLIIHNGAYQFAHGNSIHHITPASEGGTEEDTNIILLCPNHHKQADLGLIPREELRKHTKPISLSGAEVDQAIKKCTDTIARYIFGNE